MAKKLAFDRVLFTVVVLLVGLGLVMVYSASAPMARAEGRAVNPFLVRQAIAALVGFTAMLVLMHVDYRRYKDRRVVTAMIGGAILLLVCQLMTALAIVRERELGTLEQLLVSPLRPFELILGKTIPFAIIGLAARLWLPA